MQRDPRREWTDDELSALEDHDHWDFDSAFVHPPVENPGAQVNIRLTRPQLVMIEQAARVQGKTITEYIVSTTVEQASLHVHVERVSDTIQRDDW